MATHWNKSTAKQEGSRSSSRAMAAINAGGYHLQYVLLALAVLATLTTVGMVLVKVLFSIFLDL